MSDLISRKVLLNELDNKNSPYETIVNIEDTDTTQDIINKTLTEYRKILKDMVKNQPTAYDVEKVVEELELHKLNPYFAAYERKRINEAIEIVKGGGVDEN